MTPFEELVVRHYMLHMIGPAAHQTHVVSGVWKVRIDAVYGYVGIDEPHPHAGRHLDASQGTKSALFCD